MHRRKDVPLCTTFSCVRDRTAGHLDTGKGDIGHPVRAAGQWEKRECERPTASRASESSSSRPRLQPPGLAPPAVTHPIVKVFLGGISVSVTCSRKHLRWSISQPSLDPLAQVGLDPPVTCHSPMLPLPLVPGPVAQGQGSLQPVSPVWGLPLN